MTAQILAFCNQKGGVGKSTTTFQLARAAVLAGRRVLIVDNDPQGNITSNAAQDDVPSDQPGLADVLSTRTTDTLRDVIVPGVWPGLDLVPTAGGSLGFVRDELTIAGAGREVRLREALELVLEDYDLVLIDCAPSLDQLTVNGLTAADGVVIVTHTKKWSLDGLSQLLDTIDTVKRYYNRQLRVAGIIVNHHEDRTVGGKEWLEALHAAADLRELTVLTPPIPKRVVIADATEASRGVDEFGSAEGVALGAVYAAHLASIEGALA
ncbi:ParA family protein [Pseudoclavibacter sp. RFBA6]|uniref:ParA family protein n=1 Tax=Pseudoclavibacter sp. RFBA6 TaxID=2080573 RepID=UPI000CE8BE0D|nr:ParA family protein [Pseudoclavibacter sp. RFBA6]PPG43753.1 cobalamin biosynthesis protein CobQ [Pseudoclavibacter sp. RFBA6]